ncbi:MAG: hypothetical protein ACHP7P_17060 [Terriglobales bacterium]
MISLKEGIDEQSSAPAAHGAIGRPSDYRDYRSHLTRSLPNLFGQKAVAQPVPDGLQRRRLDAGI